MGSGSSNSLSSDRAVRGRRIEQSVANIILGTFGEQDAWIRMDESGGERVMFSGGVVGWWGGLENVEWRRGEEIVCRNRERRNRENYVGRERAISGFLSPWKNIRQKERTMSSSFLSDGCFSPRNALASALKIISISPLNF